jgi:glycosyltransferase involved in cell wall biosynthesis
MRIALFTETFLPKIDGIVKVVCLTLDHFQRRGVKAVVVAHDRGVTEYAGAPVIGVRGLPAPFYPELRLGPPTPNTYLKIKNFQPDVIHTIHPVIVGLGGMLMAKRLHVPTVASFHIDLMRMSHFYGLGLLEPLAWLLTRTTFNWADVALAPSKLIQGEMRDNGVRDVGLWRRGVDAKTFNPCYRDDGMRAALSDGHPEDTILLYVGRVSVEKQIEQVRAVLEQVPGSRLAIVGDGPHRASLETYFEGLPVKFMGYLTGEDLSRAYASADIFVFTSALETFGLVVVEAMAAGLPVVSARVGGVVDVVQEGVTGYTFEVDDVAGLVEGVRAIAGPPGRRVEMGLAARAYAETQSWEAIMDELLDVYRALIAHKAANSPG